VEITRSKVTIDLVGDELGFIYYVIANRYIPVPYFYGVKNQNLLSSKYNDSRPIYGVGYIKDLGLFKT